MSRVALATVWAWALVALPSAASAVPKSLFVQVTSVPVGAEAYKTRTWFKKVCDAHKSPGSADYIHNIVLSEIASPIGVLDDARLDIVEDYFSCFDNVFVGTVNLPHADPYVSGMKDSTFRWDNIYLSESVAKAYDARLESKLPGQAIHWYVSYEANLNYFASDAALANAYAAYLLELSNRFTAVRPASVLWSPALWTKVSAVPSQAALNNAIVNVMTTAPKVNWLHFQDFVGQAAKRSCSTGAVSYGFSEADGIGYFNLLSQALSGKLTSLRVNMEHFVLGGAGCPAGSIYPGEAAELSNRESAYQAAGVPIGASWEIRWWYLAHYGSEGQACNKVESCNGLDDDCDLQVDEGGVCSAGGGGAPGGGGGSSGGGAAGVGGTPGVGGALDAGGSAGGGIGGAPGAGGVNAGAGGVASQPKRNAGDGEGCGCRAEARAGGARWLLAALLALGVATRRRARLSAN